MVFSIWNEKNICLSWEDTKEWCKLLDLKHVPILYEGYWYSDIIKKLYKPEFDSDPCEGYVVRLSDKFSYTSFRDSVAKYVSKKFSENIKSEHWMYQKIVENKRKILSYEYNGEYPSLCKGKLMVYIEDKKFEFKSLKSSGSVQKTRKGYKIIQGNWYIDQWPDNFPIELKEFLIYKINNDGIIPKPCCGGCC
jgi:hypothetical protein